MKYVTNIQDKLNNDVNISVTLFMIFFQCVPKPSEQIPVYLVITDYVSAAFIGCNVLPCRIYLTARYVHKISP